jgi:hypothetical protein
MQANAPTVRVKAQFQRSVRLDTDIDRADALSGYVIQPSPLSAIESVAKFVNETQQRAFTWTGPYGGGKSSLALALGQLAGGLPKVRKSAAKILGLQANDPLSAVFSTPKPWLVIPVVGQRDAAEECIGNAIDLLAPLPGRKLTKRGKRDVVAELLKRAESDSFAGVILILDELGKFLDAAAIAGHDIHFYQELAEAASRCRGNLVVVGILHQAFERYASRLGSEVRDEWAKVQGRFVDIPIVAGTDELIDLIGRAIECNVPHPKSVRAAKQIAAAIHRRRPSSPLSLADSLDRCWPLHPVTAALLGPSSRRRFGQNERSIFGFLSSAEPLGFREFLKAHCTEGDLSSYLPSHYWEYLRANLENAILASPDGHRWASGAEAVERSEARFGEPHVSLVKAIGLIELFKNGSGLSAEEDVLLECVPNATKKALLEALEELKAASILVYRKHVKAWGIFAGSDFDIEAALIAAKNEVGEVATKQLKGLTNFSAISARRHYVETGTLRWFDRNVLLATHATLAEPEKIARSASGRFTLLLCSLDCDEKRSLIIAKKLSEKERSPIHLYGVPARPLNLMAQANELALLEHILSKEPQLQGDTIAQREIKARVQRAREDVETLLRDGFANARWFFHGKQFDVTLTQGLSSLASAVCDDVFQSAPIIHSELVNRDTLSSSAAQAQRLLLHQMLKHGDSANLDYVGHSSDAGVYFTVLRELGIHRSLGEKWGFETSRNQDGSYGKLPLWLSTATLWIKTDEILASQNDAVALSGIYKLWTSAPFGLKQGLLPILALAYLLANRSRIAVYVEGVFVPELTDAHVDEWLQDPARISWKGVVIDDNKVQLLTALSETLGAISGRPVLADPLDSARALVSLTFALPQWTQRTKHVSEKTRTIRALLLRASDPVKVIFNDLPELLGTAEVAPLMTLIRAIVEELQSAYPSALQKIQDRLVRAIDHSGDVDSLRARARAIQGVSGDFLLDAFASRLQTFNGETSDIEGLVSLAVSKPPSGFTDHDFDQATLQLAKWAFEFRRVEALASVQGRTASRRAIAVVFGSGRTISGTFDVAESDGKAVQRLADDMLSQLTNGTVKPDVLLAALAEAGARLIDMQEQP